MTPTLVLASASPRRKELLERVGVPIVVRPADIDEAPHPGEAPLAYVARVAAAKTDAVLAELKAQGHAAWVLGADTVVEIDDRILGKAADPAEALTMLRRLSGRAHRVSTAFCLRGPDAGADRIVTTEVIMRPAPDAELADYVRAGEWQGKAGAYAVQGMAAALVIDIRGSVTNVMGLPLAEVLEEMARLGAGGPRYDRGTPA
jgi:septum formation protein